MSKSIGITSKPIKIEGGVWKNGIGQSVQATITIDPSKIGGLVNRALKSLKGHTQAYATGANGSITVEIKPSPEKP